MEPVHGRLGRRVEFDDQSRKYDIAERLTAAPLATKTWACTVRLDQGQDGACTGFARAADLAASPKAASGIDDAFAFNLYGLAKKYDEWPGEDYDGSSVLGAIKGAVHLGYIGEYRWAFGIDDMLQALAQVGPVVLGTNWLSGMWDPNGSGVLDVSGSAEDGHSYLARGVLVPRGGYARPGNWHGKQVKSSEPLVRIVNSWGRGWGFGGEALIPASGMERLLKDQGEAAISTVAYARPRA